MSHLIKVTNYNAFTIKDYFEGIPYVFATDEPVNVPLDAMQHIFGMDFPADEAVLKSRVFRDELFNHCCKRFGWNSHDAEKIKGYKANLDNIKFVPVITKMIEVVADAGIPEPREQKPVTKAKPGKYAPQTQEPEETEEVA